MVCKRRRKCLHIKWLKCRVGFAILHAIPGILNFINCLVIKLIVWLSETKLRVYKFIELTSSFYKITVLNAKTIYIYNLKVIFKAILHDLLVVQIYNFYI